MCTPRVEATSLIAIILGIDSGLKCNSISKNLKGAIYVKVFEPPFVYTVKVPSEAQSQTFPIIDLSFHTLEVE